MTESPDNEEPIGGSAWKPRSREAGPRDEVTLPPGQPAEETAGTDPAGSEPLAALNATNPQAVVFPWTLPLNPALWRLEAGDANGEQGIEAVPAIDAAPAVAAVEGQAEGFAAVTPAFAASADAGGTMPSAAPFAAAAAASETGAPLAETAAAQVAAQGQAGWMTAPAPGTTDAVAGPGADAVPAAITNAFADGAGATPDPGAAAATMAAQQTVAAAQTGDHIDFTSAIDAGDSQALSSSSTSTTQALAAAAESAAATSTNETGAQAGAVETAGTGSQVVTDEAHRQAAAELLRAMQEPRAGKATIPGTHIRTNAAGQGSTEAAASVQTDGSALAGAAFGQTLTSNATTAAQDAAAAAYAEASAHAAASAQNGAQTEAAGAEEADAFTDATAWASSSTTAQANLETADAGTSQDSSHHRQGDASLDSSASTTSAARGAGETAAPVSFDSRALTAALAAQAAHDGPTGSSHDSSTPIVTTGSHEEQAAQIVRSMRLRWRGSMGEAQLRLQPEHLGQVLVHVRVDQGTVTATLQAETPGAQQWIEAHQQQLRDALDAQGLRVAELHVTTNPDDRRRRDAEQDEPRQSRGRQVRNRAAAEERRFEIRV